MQAASRSAELEPEILAVGGKVARGQVRKGLGGRAGHSARAGRAPVRLGLSAQLGPAAAGTGGWTPGRGRPARLDEKPRRPEGRGSQRERKAGATFRETTTRGGLQGPGQQTEPLLSGRGGGGWGVVVFQGQKLSVCSEPLTQPGPCTAGRREMTTCSEGPLKFAEHGPGGPGELVFSRRRLPPWKGMGPA